MRRIIFFIDGFNVYHALEDDIQYHKHKWLNYAALSKCYITKKDTIERVLYFTAYAHWNPSKVARHKVFIKALELEGVEIVFGKFKKRTKKCRLCYKIYSTFEEKQTDVNIAIKLFQHAIDDDFDRAIIMSGDGDLIPAIKEVKKTFPAKEIGLVIPIGRRSEELKQECDFHMKMKQKHLTASQFPPTIVIDPAKNIVLHRPPTWT
jgi:uncharacterized LabA/DUF88 family protein